MVATIVSAFVGKMSNVMYPINICPIDICRINIC